jgi:hypothetical protein
VHGKQVRRDVVTKQELGLVYCARKGNKDTKVHGAMSHHLGDCGPCSLIGLEPFVENVERCSLICGPHLEIRDNDRQERNGWRE